MNEYEYFTKFNSVKYVQISDAFESYYEDELKEELSEYEISAFLDAMDQFELTDESVGSTAYYKLTFYDEYNDIVDALTVNTAYTVASDTGVYLKKNEALTDWLEMLQNSHGISYELFERAPGAKFFSLLRMVRTGHLSEKTENNFIEGLEYSFDDEDIKELSSIENDIEIADKYEDVEWKYELNFYSENEACLYRFLVTENGNIYTSSGYKLLGTQISDWWTSIMKKAN